MMTPEMFDDDQDREIKFLSFLSNRQKVGIGIGLSLLLVFAGMSLTSRPKEQQEREVKQVFTPSINETSVEKAEDLERSSFHLQLVRMESGLVQTQANYYLGQAINFQNDTGHYCSGKSLVSCLRSFQKTRESDILALELSEGVGTNEKNTEIQQRVFEIVAIEVAILRIEENNDPVKQQFVSTVVPYEDVKNPPTVSFVEAFQSYRRREEMKEARREETAKELVNNQKLIDCKVKGGDCL